MLSDARILLSKKSDFFPREIIEQFVGFLMRQKHPIFLLLRGQSILTASHEFLVFRSFLEKRWSSRTTVPTLRAAINPIEVQV
jgi:hypothetical protein